MTIENFEKKIQLEINPELRVVPHPVNGDMAGVYFRQAYLLGVPSHNIYEEKNLGYCNAYGEPHTTIPVVVGRIRNYLNEMNRDPELYELMAKPADQL